MSDKSNSTDILKAGIAIITVMTVLIIPLRILSLGYTPTDDAMRHAAKVISEKTWEEILVRRPEVTIDHNGGWHSILGAVQQSLKIDGEGLVTFSVGALFLLVLLSGLFWTNRPESWLTSVLFMNLVGIKTFAYRLALGRPYLITMAAYVTILFIWQNKRAYLSGWKLIASTTVLIAIASWAHGAWYLFAIPVAGFILTARWKDACTLSLGCALGSILAALMTGHPVVFLLQQVQLTLACFADKVPEVLLVPEFRPSNGAWPTVMLILIFALLKCRRDKSILPLLKNPVFALVVICWLLGLKVMRFWLDWGIPAAIVFISLEIDVIANKCIPAGSRMRPAMALVICVSLFYSLTANFGNRWTYSLSTEFLDHTNPEHAGWLPDSEGIIYSNSMETYFHTFFRNPHANWRYIAGHEPTQMPHDDIKTYRAINLRPKDPESYSPWIEKMSMADRLILKKIPRPYIPELEWNMPLKDTWIGRLPRK